MIRRLLLAIAILLCCASALGATHQTRNFRVSCQDQATAVAVAENCEAARAGIALLLFSSELPDWAEREAKRVGTKWYCPADVVVERE